MLFADSPCEKAGYPMALFYLFQGGFLGTADIFCIETTRVKPASWWRIDGAGDISLQDDPFLPRCWIRGR